MLWRKNAESTVESNHDSRVEVVVNKDANKKIAQNAKDVNAKLNRILGENHFTIKIFLAAGGETKKGTVNGH